MKQKGRKGPRPHTWKIQGEIPHQQWVAYVKMRAQANFRGEPFLISFEDFQELWQGYWEQRGRAREDYCLAREDHEGAWEKTNIACVQRVEYLRRQVEFKKEKFKNGRDRNQVHS